MPSSYEDVRAGIGAGRVGGYTSFGKPFGHRFGTLSDAAEFALVADSGERCTGGREEATAES